MNLQQEFKRQLQNLLQKDYPKMAKVSEEEFKKWVTPLEKKLKNLNLGEPDLENGYLPFVIVVKSEKVSTKQAMEKAEKDEKEGITKLFPQEPEDFTTIEEVKIPQEPVYLIAEIDRGQKTLNVTPHNALLSITKAKRSPLTIDEGVAIVTQFPEFLKKNNCFSLLASRNKGDKKVPAIWINASKNPNLGWCWDGNPHTWLGSASCKERIS